MGMALAATLGAGALQGIGQGLAGQAQAKASTNATNDNSKVSLGQSAMQTQRGLDSAPIRDRAMYLLQQRLGMTPQTFQPHDIYNQSTSAATPQYGGYNPQQMAQAQAAYTPGAGNVNTAVADQYMNKIGYGQNETNPLGTAQGQVGEYQANHSAPTPEALAAKQAQLQALVNRFR